MALAGGSRRLHAVGMAGAESAGAFEEPAGAPDSPRGSPPPGRGRVALALVAGLVGGASALGIATAAGLGEVSQRTVVVRILPNTSTFVTRPADIQGVLGNLLPAVASIRAVTRAENPTFPFTTTESVAEGTGMVVTSTGDILTNAHVVEGARTITVTLDASGVSLPARVAAIDPSQDLALVRVSGERALPTVHFADSSTTRVGDGVIAIGYALGLAGGPTVTDGIVSALGRAVTTSSDGSSVILENMLQTDAAINPGNSGGPLVDSSSLVVGVNTAVAGASSSGTSAQNIGFAIPASTVEKLLATWRSQGRL